MNRNWMIGAALVLALMAVVMMGGCDNSGAIQVYREQLADANQHVAELRTAVADLRTERVKLQEQLDALPAGAERDRVQNLVNMADAKIERGLSAVEPWLQRLQQLQVAVTAAKSDQEAMDATIPLLVQSMPVAWQPYAVLAVSVLGLGGALIRSMRRAWAGESVVASIQAAKSGDGIVNFNDPATAEILDAVQTPAAKKLVDSIQSKT